jgi:hypothetical protein
MSKPRLKYVACHRGTAVMDLQLAPGLLRKCYSRGPLKGCHTATKANARGRINCFLIRGGLGNDRFALEFRPVIRIEL